MSDLPATQGDVQMPTGLEDFSIETDGTTPFVSIEHDKAVFVDKLTGKEYGALENIVLLGMVKQRVLWSTDLDDNDLLCKSHEGLTGHTGAKFPWKASGFDPKEFEAADDDPTQFQLPCKDCKLKDWDSHPNRDTPWCALQHTYPFLMPVGDDPDDQMYVVSMLTVQRSALKNSNGYLNGFVNENKPLFTVFTTINLDQRSRGGRSYCVPKFLRQGATNQDDWPGYGTRYKEIRKFLQTPRGFGATAMDEAGETPVATPATNGATEPPTAPVMPPVATPATAAPAAASNTDIPF